MKWRKRTRDTNATLGKGKGIMRWSRYMNQFDGFYGTVTNEYELYKGDECVMDHLSESQVIALASIL